jgi:hypothetical protein
MQFYNNDAGAVGAVLPLWHDSASAADGDIAGEVQVWGGADDEEIGQIRMEVDDGTTLSEDTQWQFVNRRAGADLTALTLGHTTLTGDYGATIGFGSVNGALELNTAADTAFGAYLYTYHNDPSPDVNDEIGGMIMDGEDDAGNLQVYGRVVTTINDPASTSEDSQLELTLVSAGSLLNALTLGTTTTAASLYGHTFILGGAAAGALQVESTVDDAFGAYLSLYHNDPSPDASDEIGGLALYGEDSAGNSQRYGIMAASIVDATSASEDGSLTIAHVSAGASVTTFGVGIADGTDSGIFTNTDGSVVLLDNQSNLRFYETEANGDNYKALLSAAANTADTNCTFENDANFIPDSCVGDGSDASDGRLKDVIGPAGDVGAMIDGIKIYDYKWNTDAADESEDIRKGKRGFGPIAQELFNLNADFVDVGGDDPLTDPWTWKPEKVVPYLIVETQNLRKRVKALEAQSIPTCYGIKLGSACIGVSM